MLGDGGVGKTSLKNRYLTGEFTDKYLTTLGVDFASHSLILDGKEIFIQIWDVAGQDIFSSIRSSYFQGAKGALIVFDVTRPETFENLLEKWIRPFFNSLDDKPPIAVLGNKSDLTNERKLNHEPGLELVKKIKNEFELENDVPYFETSAKEGVNVNAAFESITRIVLKNAEPI
jgi:Ras-related protein Rab-7A